MSAPDAAAVAAAFARNFEERGELGASLSVWQGDEEIISLSAGARTREESGTWNADTIVPVYSATKGPASLALLLVLHDSGLTPDAAVQSVWPELRARITFGQMLSHQAGLAALDETPSIFDHVAVAHALERQLPQWEPGAAHGYHPRTFGFLLEECARRLCGRGIGTVLRERITGPLAADFWIGLPPAEHHRVARLFPGKAKPPAPDDAAFYAAFAQPGSLTRRAFASPAGLHSVADMNRAEAWIAALPAQGGTGTARGLAKIYALLARGGEWHGRRLVPPRVIEWITTARVNGPDKVLLMPSRFSAGFMLDPLNAAGEKVRTHFGPDINAFGHPGAGGSLAFADPDSGLAVACVMNQMEQGVMPGPRALSLVAAVYEDKSISPGCRSGGKR